MVKYNIIYSVTTNNIQHIVSIVVTSYESKNNKYTDNWYIPVDI